MSISSCTVNEPQGAAALRHPRFTGEKTMLDRLIRRIRLILQNAPVSLRPIWDVTRQAFLHPTIKQLEYYGRIAQTLSSASFIGFVTVIVTDKRSAWTFVEALMLLVVAVLLLVLGAILSKGE
ncbi:hypothetical protein BYI23_E001640 (plasmid) [Burkholderia sp. YI23]|nr:hypothetical protein BYI23_E001640 [Burkholderia sp. YI23]